MGVGFGAGGTSGEPAVVAAQNFCCWGLLPWKTRAGKEWSPQQGAPGRGYVRRVLGHRLAAREAISPWASPGVGLDRRLARGTEVAKSPSERAAVLCHSRRGRGRLVESSTSWLAVCGPSERERGLGNQKKLSSKRPGVSKFVK